MKQKLYRLGLSLSLYWAVASFAHHVVDFPDKVITIAAFIPPVLGLMWGLPAAKVCISARYSLCPTCVIF